MAPLTSISHPLLITIDAPAGLVVRDALHHGAGLFLGLDYGANVQYPPFFLITVTR